MAADGQAAAQEADQDTLGDQRVGKEALAAEGDGQGQGGGPQGTPDEGRY